MSATKKRAIENSGWCGLWRFIACWPYSWSLPVKLQERPCQARQIVSTKSWALLLLESLVLLSIINCSRQSAPLRPEIARAELQRKGVDYNAKAFVESARNGDQDVVKLFMDAGMDPDARGDAGSTALMQASRSGNDSLVNTLLARGADVSLSDDDGLTALHWAAGSPHGSKCVRTLLAHGADPNPRSHSGNTPLHEAIILTLSDPSAEFLLSNYVDTMTALLDKGADPNAKNYHGVSILMRAASLGNSLIVKMLIDRGADVRALDTGGKTARMYASEYGHDEIARIIGEAGG